MTHVEVGQIASGAVVRRHHLHPAAIAEEEEISTRTSGLYFLCADTHTWRL